mgnify:CR=1 FL=1
MAWGGMVRLPRASAGAVYWEGASRLREAGRLVGRGYLELTGYAAPMRL